MPMLRAFLATLLLLLGAGAALAEPSGTALGVDPAAEAHGGSETRTLVVGSDLFIGDRVVTGDTGLVQIMFADQTRLVVGPNSSLVLEDYLIRNDGSAGRFAVDALSGSFRFITGGAPKDRYVIRTPTGTIGVRGTAFDLFVTALATYVLQLHGSTIDCPDASPDKCEILDAVCELGIIGSDSVEIIAHTDEIGGEQRESLKAMFSLIGADLLREFRIAGAERCLRRPAGGDGNGNSLSDGGSGNVPTPTTPPPTTPPPCVNQRIC